MNKNVSKRFFSETTRTIETKLPRNKSLEGPLQNLCFFYADRKFKMAATCRSRHFEFHTGTKNVMSVEDHLMNIHVQFGFNHICSF
jgi:hypothetical protein